MRFWHVLANHLHLVPPLMLALKISRHFGYPGWRIDRACGQIFLREPRVMANGTKVSFSSEEENGSWRLEAEMSTLNAVVESIDISMRCSRLVKSFLYVRLTVPDGQGFLPVERSSPSLRPDISIDDGEYL